MVKNLPVNEGCRIQKTRRFNPCIGKIPRGANGSPLQYSCWRIPWTGASGRLQSLRLHRAGHGWSDWAPMEESDTGPDNRWLKAKNQRRTPNFPSPEHLRTGKNCLQMSSPYSPTFPFEIKHRCPPLSGSSASLWQPKTDTCSQNHMILSTVTVRCSMYLWLLFICGWLM